jgi:hypothetical protein
MRVHVPWLAFCCSAEKAMCGFACGPKAEPEFVLVIFLEWYGLKNLPNSVEGKFL